MRSLKSGLIIIGLLLGLSRAGLCNNETLLNGFEGPEEISKWVAYASSLEESLGKQYVKGGNSSGKLTAYSGTGIWPGLELNTSNGGLRITDWSNYDFLTAEVYDSGPTDIRLFDLYLYIEDSNGWCYWSPGYLLSRQAWTRAKFSVKEMKECVPRKLVDGEYKPGKEGDFDIQELKLARLYFNSPIPIARPGSPQPNGPVFYFDDIKLVAGEPKEEKTGKGDLTIGGGDVLAQPEPGSGLEGEFAVEVKLIKDYDHNLIGYPGIYYPGDPVWLKSYLKNNSNSDVSVIFKYEVSNFYNQVIKEGQSKLTAQPYSLANTPRDDITPQFASSNGVYYIRYEFLSKDGVIGQGVTTFAVIPPPQEAKVKLEDSPFGVGGGVPDLMPLFGIRWMRRDYSWEAMEPEKKGEFNYEFLTKMDILADLAKKYEFNILGILDYCVPWASTGPPGAKNIYSAPFYPPKLDEWERFVTNMVSRYKGKVKAWEVWNETDGNMCEDIHGKPQRYIDKIIKGIYTAVRGDEDIDYTSSIPATYVQMLKTAYLAAKKIDPDCIIVGGGGGIEFLEDVFKAGGLEYCDAVSYHGYRIDLDPPEEKIHSPVEAGEEHRNFLDDFKKVKGLIDKYGHGKSIPVWQTEYGWWADDLDPDSELFRRRGQILTDKEQANYLVRSYVQALSLDFAGTNFWFSDYHPSQYLAEDSAGAGISLYYRDYRVKPALLAYRTMIDELEGAKFVRSQDSGTIKSYTFKDIAGKEITAAWSTEGGCPVFIESQEKIILVDIMHNRHEMSPGAGQIPFLLNETPVFLESKGVKISDKFIELDGRLKDIFLESPASVKIQVINPTKRTLSGKIKIDGLIGIEVQPQIESFSIDSGKSKVMEFLISVSEKKTVGRQKCRVVASFPEYERTIEQELEVSVIKEIIKIDDFEGTSLSSWSDNSQEKKVDYGKFEISSEYSYQGKRSLHWKCKAFPHWNNLNRNLENVNSADGRELEFWLYLPEKPLGRNILSVELVDGGGNRFGYWGKIRLYETKKWIRVVIPLGDFVPVVPGTQMSTKRGILSFTLNYSDGEFEGYIDNITLRK